MNYDSKHSSAPCTRVQADADGTPELRGEKIPCHHIPANERGELYRYADHHETERVFRTWLRSIIGKLERAAGP
jgi:hypothetical protein